MFELGYNVLPQLTLYQKSFCELPMCMHLIHKLVIPIFLVIHSGSKPITRNQKDYFGKGLQDLFPKNNFYMKMNFCMNVFVTCSKNIKIFPNASHFFVSHYQINMNLKKYYNSL
jgi:hypothetical protein